MSGSPIPVRVSEIRVLKESGVLLAIGLGSCVAAALYDSEHRVGGLIHILLPTPTHGRDAPPGRYATTAVPELLRMLEAEGASRQALTARIVGGASMFKGLAPNGAGATGVRNAEAVRQALTDLGVPVTGEDLGGDWGRSVHFDIATGRLTVTSVLRDDVVL